MTGTSDSQALNMVLYATRFALEHPYAATFIAGGAVGAFGTYKFLTIQPKVTTNGQVVDPKVYEVEVPDAVLEEMLQDPSLQARWDLEEVSIVISAEQRKKLRELPDIVREPSSE